MPRIDTGIWRLSAARGIRSVFRRSRIGPVDRRLGGLVGVGCGWHRWRGTQGWIRLLGRHAADV